MKPLHKGFRALCSDLVTIVCVCGVVGIALKFAFFQVVLNLGLYEGSVLESVVFPFFPNLLDSAVLILASCWLVYRKKRR